MLALDCSPRHARPVQPSRALPSSFHLPPSACKPFRNWQMCSFRLRWANKSNDARYLSLCSQFMFFNNANSISSDADYIVMRAWNVPLHTAQISANVSFDGYVSCMHLYLIFQPWFHDSMILFVKPTFCIFFLFAYYFRNSYNVQLIVVYATLYIVHCALSTHFFCNVYCCCVRIPSTTSSECRMSSWRQQPEWYSISATIYGNDIDDASDSMHA